MADSQENDWDRYVYLGIAPDVLRQMRGWQDTDVRTGGALFLRDL